MKNKNYARGFTLIEMLVVIGIIAVLAGVVLVAVNPVRQFKLARDSQRLANVNSILNAIGQNIAENKGQFKCDGEVTTISGSAVRMKSPVDGDEIDIRDCIVPLYISEVPIDPTIGDFEDGDEYDTGYDISEDSNGRISIKARGEIEEEISVTR